MTPQQRSNRSSSAEGTGVLKEASSWRSGPEALRLGGLGLGCPKLRENPQVVRGRKGAWCFPSALLRYRCPAFALLQWLLMPGSCQGLFVSFWILVLKVKSLSRVQLFATPRTVAYQVLGPWDSPGKSTGVGCHFLLQGNLPDPGIELRSPTLQADALTSEPPGKPVCTCLKHGQIHHLPRSYCLPGPQNIFLRQVV